MEPTLHHGDFVVVHTFFKTLKKRDIVLCKHPITGVQVIKRIVQVKNSVYELAGDNLQQSTNFRGIARQAILAKHAFSIKAPHMHP